MISRFIACLVLTLLGNLIVAQTDSIHSDATDSTSRANQIPVFSTNGGDLDAEQESQDMSALLQSSRDVYTATAGFYWGQARYRIRGYSGENQIVMINGVPVNSLETGMASWTSWGGLNDVTRFMEVRNGTGACRYNFGGIGGYSNIDTKASSFKKSSRISYAVTNRIFRHRVLASYSTGMMQNGFAVTFAGSLRYSKEGYVDGTFFNAAAYYLSVDKKINERHLLSFTGFGAPITQGRQGPAVQEAYNLAGTNYYNPYWGYQNGEKRNAHVSTTHRPMTMLSHYFKLNEQSRLTSTLYFTFGQSGLSNLNWYDAKDPRPDYYKYLPSYYASDPSLTSQYQQQLTAWQNDVNTRQINWDQLYFANSKNLFTVTNANGISGNTIEGLRSKYIIENVRTDIRSGGFNTVFNSRIKNVFFSAGLNANLYKSMNFKILEDLLGGEFWLDYDQFALQTANNPTTEQNNLDIQNQLIRKGDRFGFDYDLNVNKAEAWAQTEYSWKKWDLYAGFSLSGTSMWRTGNLRNGKFPTTSGGESQKLNFYNYGVKAGAVYKLTGRHYFSFNAASMTRAPECRNVFISPRTRNDIVNGVGNEEIGTLDLSYYLRLSQLKIRVTGYYTQINNQVWTRRFYHDDYRNNVNYIINGMNEVHQGVEFGAEYKIGASATLTAAVGHGQFFWSNRPAAYITLDNSAQVLAEGKTVYMQNYNLGNMPQSAGSLGFKWTGKKYWFAGTNASYIGNFYVEANPDRRTESAVSNYVVSDPQWNQILDQQRLQPNLLLDFYGGKSFRVKKGTINWNINISNALNNNGIATVAIEQLRYDPATITKWPPKYSYLMGFNYFTMVAYTF
jgi:TonB-dependent Receptor Plug Domain